MPLHYARLAEPPARLTAAPARTAPAGRWRRRSTHARQRFGIDGPYAVLCPGAEYGPAKRWPYFAELRRRARNARPCSSARPTTAMPRQGILGTNLVGETTLDEAIDLIAGARLVVTNDSGLMHVAAALGRPLVALFGSSSPEHTPPLSAGGARALAAQSSAARASSANARSGISAACAK